MGSRRWVVIGVGGVVAAGLVVAAVVFGVRGLEVASWLAGAASFVVAVAALVLALPRNSAAAPTSPAAVTPPPAAGSGSGSGSINVRGDLSGIASTGENATNTQHR